MLSEEYQWAAYQLPALHVEHIDKHGDIPEDVVLLRLEVLFHEGLLAAAVPQIQHQIAEESHVWVLHIDWKGFVYISKSLGNRVSTHL